MIYTVSRFTSKLSKCGGAKTPTISAAGKQVFWNGKVAWVCMASSGGRKIKVSAYGPFLTGHQLGTVVGSARHTSTS
jgi:hypothetical protein